MLNNKTINVQKLAVAAAGAVMFFCVLILLPSVQNALLAVLKGQSAVQAGRSGTFGERFLSLLSLAFAVFVLCVFFLCCVYSKYIAAFFEDARREKIITTAASAVIALVLIYITVFSYKNGYRWLNSDHASEMILGKLLSEENTLVSRNWHYSTEIRIVYQTIFTMPLFKLFGGAATNNWAFIRAINILLNNIVLILSYIFLMNQTKIQRKWILISAIFLVIPISNIYWDLILFGGYYTFFTAQMFCLLGLFLRLKNNAENTRKSKIDFALFLILSFILGAQTIRALLAAHIPLLLACIYCFFRDSKRDKKILFAGICGFILCGAGFFVNNILHLFYSFHTFDTMRLDNIFANFLSKTGESIAAFMNLFGFAVGARIVSAAGLWSAASIAAVVLLFCASFKNRKLFLPLFFICSAGFNVFVFIISEQDIKLRYFIPFIILYVPLTALFFEYLEKTKTALFRVAAITGVILFVAGHGYLNLQSLKNVDFNVTRNGYIKYLLDNNLNFGFGAFINGNVTTELTSGKIEIAGLEPAEELKNNNYRLQGWLNKNQFYKSDFYPKSTFLLLSAAEWNIARDLGAPFAQRTPDYQDENFIVLRYPSSMIIHEEVLDK